MGKTRIDWCDYAWPVVVHRVGRRLAGHLLDGQEWRQFPNA